MNCGRFRQTKMKVKLNFSTTEARNSMNLVEDQLKATQIFFISKKANKISERIKCRDFLLRHK